VRARMRIRSEFRVWLSWAVLLVAAVVAHAAEPGTRGTPFKFRALGVGNPCFVDSVRFADTYLGGRKAGGSRWVRVLRWGTLDDDYAMGPGHAVAIFQWRGGLFLFDINNGVRKLTVPPARREDLHEVTAAVLSLYPQVKQTGAMLLDDSWSRRRPGLRGALAGPATPGFRAAERVAKALAKCREVRVLRFSYLEKGKRRESAAAVFPFDRRLCLYVPERGTVMHKQVAPDLDDDRLILLKLERCFGREAQVQLVPVGDHGGEAPRPVPPPGRAKGK